MAILMLVASGRADGAVESAVAESHSAPGVPRMVDVGPEPGHETSRWDAELLCASAAWTRADFAPDR